MEGLINQIPQLDPSTKGELVREALATMNESAKTEPLLALFNGNQKTNIPNSVNKDYEDNLRTPYKLLIEYSSEVKIEVIRSANSFFF